MKIAIKRVQSSNLFGALPSVSSLREAKQHFIIFSVLLPSVILLLAFSKQKTVTLEKLGWNLAYQSYTFKNFTFEEGLQKAAELGLEFVEAYPGQKLSLNNPDPVHHRSDQATRKEMKQLLKKYRITLVNYGVVGGKDETEWKQIFDFAKEMGIQTITSEPNPAQLDFLSKMCDEYKINIAIHNHPKPSRYFAPDSVLKYVSGRSERIGACADVGHWVRSGLDPVESLKKLEGRIISLHFKDLNEIDRKAHDVPWGTGVCNVPALLQELKDQKYKGIFSIEYEYNWDNNVPEIAQSIRSFNSITADLN
jgi:sugar phosphate isomerase/epimerase